ncbi:hypothetical protein BD311DRAFT_516935 [Dichomitus squalens]|uniref:Uncharacterized protein n=1 Tax=Dichomitus squalens TaxID=114155 RepID=A0A4Q9MZI9_9APHY|nr:hypothetical protein BD311DRAFT_516935 [Dichomitus squalens]
MSDEMEACLVCICVSARSYCAGLLVQSFTLETGPVCAPRTRHQLSKLRAIGRPPKGGACSLVLPPVFPRSYHL